MSHTATSRQEVSVSLLFYVTVGDISVLWQYIHVQVWPTVTHPSHGHVGFFCPVEHKHGTTLFTDPPRDQTQAGTFCICIETQKEIVVNFNIFSRGNYPILQPSQSTLLSMFVFAKKLALSRCMRILNTSIFKNWMFNLSVYTSINWQN